MTSAPAIPPAVSRDDRLLVQLDALTPLPPSIREIFDWLVNDETDARAWRDVAHRHSAINAALRDAPPEHHADGPRDDTHPPRVEQLPADQAARTTLVRLLRAFVNPDPTPDATEVFDPADAWRLAVRAALVAERIAKHTSGSRAAGHAFCAGLLHEVGRIALHAVVPRSLARAMRNARTHRTDIVAAEQRLFGLDHLAAGRYLAERWSLPAMIRQAVALQAHAPDALPPTIDPAIHCALLARAAMGRAADAPWWAHTAGSLESLLADERFGDIDADRLHDWVRDAEDQTDAMLGDARTAPLSLVDPSDTPRDERAARLTACLEALASLMRTTTCSAPLHALAGRAAEAVCCALNLDDATVLVFDNTAQTLTVSRRHGDADIIAWPITDALAADATAAAELTATGLWLQSPPRAFDPILDRLAADLRHDDAWLFPLVSENRWVAGALFSTSSRHVRDVLRAPQNVEALGLTLGRLLAQARAHGELTTLQHALTDATRRWQSLRDARLNGAVLESIAEMASGAAHELNTPLAIISGRAQLLRREATDDRSAAVLDTIAGAARTCSEIVSDLLAFAAPRPPRPQAIDLYTIVDTLRAQLISQGLLDAPRFVIDLPSDTPAVHVDPDQLSAVLRELIQNALDASDPATLRLTVKGHRDLADQSFVLSLIDNGRGMTPDVLQRATVPFFSARPAGRGRGMGLARVRRCLAAHGGDIRLNSTPGSGTRVELRLPASDARR